MGSGQDRQAQKDRVKEAVRQQKLDELMDALMWEIRPFVERVIRRAEGWCE